MKRKRTVFFRADGNSKIGLGHVIRSLALADMLKDKFDCFFITRNPSSSLQKQISEICNILPIPDTEDNTKEAKELTSKYFKGGEIIVLDGYYFNTEYQQIIKEKKNSIVCIDDIHAYHFVADVVINHAADIKADKYSIEEYGKLCLGLDYALLRKPFLEAAKKKRKIYEIENIFICFGGSDFNNITLKVIKSIVQSQLNIKQINIVLGSANINYKSIVDFIGDIDTPMIQLHNNLTAKQMCNLMMKNDLAIVPASSILYEILAVKMPVISGYYIDNQKNIYLGFCDLNLIYGVQDLNIFSSYEFAINSLRKEDVDKIIERQQQYLNGNSKNNLINIFNNI